MSERKKYDKAFKEQVVLRILSGETIASKIAEEVGAHYTTERDWVKNYKKDGSNAFLGSSNLKPEDEEVEKSRRQLADLKEENEILKKPRPTSQEI